MKAILAKVVARGVALGVVSILALTVAACAADKPVGVHQTLVGELRITGSDPFPTVMLQTDDAGTWELRGLALDEARALAGRRVKAEGMILQPPGPNIWLPSVRVDDVPQPVLR